MQIPAFNPESFYPAALSLIRIIVILAAAWFAKKVIVRLVPKVKTYAIRLMRKRDREDHFELEKRANTICGIVRGALIAIVWTLALIMAIREAGFDIRPVLAGAGVVGLAVGFGAQNLVRDMITGVFMLLENQIRVNDVVVINNTGGLVEEINLRTTVLRAFDGTRHIFPNGTITTLSNKTHDFAYYVFDVNVPLHEDPDHIEKLLQETSDELRHDPNFSHSILEPLELLGVESFGDSRVVIRARIKTLPMAQWRVGRELNRRLRQQHPC